MSDYEGDFLSHKACDEARQPHSNINADAGVNLSKDTSATPAPNCVEDTDISAEPPQNSPVGLGADQTQKRPGHRYHADQNRRTRSGRRGPGGGSGLPNLTASDREEKDNTAEPPFNTNNRLGYISGKPIEGPIDQFSYGMKLYDEDMEEQEKRRRKEIGDAFASSTLYMFENPVTNRPPQLVCYTDPEGKVVDAVDLANQQALTIYDQRKELAILKEALDNAFRVIGELQEELAKKSVGQDAGVQTEQLVHATEDESKDVQDTVDGVDEQLLLLDLE